MLVCKYKFNSALYENLIPIFNSGYNGYTITDEKDETNLFIGSTWEAGAINHSTGADKTGTSVFRSSYISIEGHTAYRINRGANVFWYDENKTFISSTIWNNNDNSVNSLVQLSPLNARYVRFYKGGELDDFTVNNMVITRTIECDSLPTQMRFGDSSWENTDIDRECSLLEVLEANISNLTTAYRMFGHCKNLIYCNMSDITNKTNSTVQMFHSCTNLISIGDVSNWDTSNLIATQGMFQNCENLTSLDVSNWNTSKVDTMQNMFENCKNLTELDLSGWDASQVTTMANMFKGNPKLTSIIFGNNWNAGNTTTTQGMFQNCTRLTSLDLNNWDTSQVTSMANMFDSCNNLTYLDVGNWDVSKVTSMEYMFQNCQNLTQLDVSKWDTSQVINMGSMFRSCSNLTSITFGDNWNTSKVTSMSSMFRGSNNLTYLDVSNWDVSSVTNMGSIFSGDNLPMNLTQLDVSNWNVDNVKDMSSMFRNCSSLTHLDVSNWNTSKVNNMGYMFYNCQNLTYLDVGNFNTNEVTTMTYMFKDCTNLTQLDVSKWNIDKVTTMGAMFYNCQNLTYLDVSNWNTSKVTNIDGMFYNCNNLTQLDLSNWNTSRVTNFAINVGTFQSSGIKRLDLRNWDISNGDHLWNMFFSSKVEVLDISNWDVSNKRIDNIFHENTNLRYIKCNNISTINAISSLLPTRTIDSKGVIICKQDDLSSIDVDTLSSKNWIVTNESTKIAEYVYDRSIYSNFIPEFNTDYIGYFCEDVIEDETKSNEVRRTIESVQGLPFRMFFGYSIISKIITQTMANSLLKVYFVDISKIQSMSAIFPNCKNLTYVNTSDWNTSNVTNMSSMFHSCNNLTSLDVSNWNTNQVNNMYYMFSDCNNLTNLDVSNWDTSNVTNMNRTFNLCYKLTQLDVSNFDTSKVTTMANMFRGCESLTQLDLSNFDTSKVTNMTQMFYGCSRLTYLDISNFNTSSLTTTESLIDIAWSSDSSIGMLYCDKDTINKLVPLLKGNGSPTIYVKDVKPNELNVVEGVIFKEYKETSDIIQLNSPLFKEDTIEVVNGRLCHVHRCASETLNGSEPSYNSSIGYGWGNLNVNYTFEGSTSRSYRLKNVKNITNVRFIIDTFKSIRGEDKKVAYFDGWGLYFFIPNDELQSLDKEGINIYFKENPTTIVYQLAQPYYEDITPLQSQFIIKTLEEGNMEILTNLPIKTNISYNTNLYSTTSLEEELNVAVMNSTNLTNLLEDEINN